jgi:hypothetical protein
MGLNGIFYKDEALTINAILVALLFQDG